MKVTPTVSTHNLELSIDSLDDVGRRKRFPHILGILQEGEIVQPFFSQFTDPGGVSLHKTIAEFFKLAVADFNVPGGFDRAPALLKLDAIGLGEMSFGIPLHVNGAELNVGVGEEALADGQQAGEVVLNEDHHASKPTLNQTTKDGFPVFEAFAARLGDAT